MQRPRFQTDRLIALLLDARTSKHSVAYSIPIIAVIGLTLLRLLSGVDLIAGLPFTTYFPAIIVTALLGGFGPGVVATLLVSIIAWYPTTPGDLSLQAWAWVLLMVLVTAANIVVVALLSATMDSAIERRRSQESAE